MSISSRRLILIATLCTVALTATAKELYTWDGADWQRFTEAKKYMFVHGFIIGTLSFVAMLLIEDTEQDTLEPGQADVLSDHVFWRIDEYVPRLLPILDAYYADKGNVAAPLQVAIYRAAHKLMKEIP